MRFAMNLPLSGIAGDVRLLVEYARLAEEVGWDALFIEDYINYTTDNYRGPTYDPWVVLGAVAVQTTRLILGTTVTALSRRRPWKVAREALTIDHLSNGRFILGVGLGDPGDPGFAAVGEVTDARARAAMLDEGLAIIDGLWRGQAFTYEGKHYQIHDLTMQPIPVQQPRIPIWVGGGWPLPGPTRRAARWDGACFYKLAGVGEWVDVTPDDIRAMRADIARYRSDDAPFDLLVGGKSPGDDLASVHPRLRALADAGATWWCEFILAGYPDAESIRRRIVQGPPRFD
jgi:alkanesulfonate monooxygenase SsuD/methylene tetrahydromethanopterin reductase-like flavin-dependent oxidoreductase (luciferase family)